MERKEKVVIYHKRCPDGFGAAYAAWKKFGDSAEYIPAGYGDEVAEGLEGRDVYLVDFCYEQPDAIKQLAATTKKLVVLDHHQTSRQRIESAPEHVYDANRSGATIAWTYFHPNTPVPRLLQHIEDGDLYRNALPDTEDLYALIVVLPDDFSVWDETVRDFENEAERPALLAKAKAYREYFELMGSLSVEAAKKVRFEGYECYFATTLPSITMRSYVAAKLYTKLPPIAIVVTAHPDGFGVSIRSDGSVDVSAIAAKYGGGGHPGSSGFFIPNGTEMPWKEIED